MADQMIFAALGTLFIGLGLPLALRRVGPNGWYGLRTPATMANEEVWYEANAISGRDFVALGSGLLVLVIVLPQVLHLSGGGYASVYTAVALIGSLGIAARGWRKANGLLRERRARDSGSAV